MTLLEVIAVVFVGFNLICGTSSVSTKGTAYLFSNTTTFTIPSGSYRLRIFAVGGGGGGCGGIKRGKGERGESAVNIIQLSGPKTVDVIVGRGGLGTQGHSVDETSTGKQSRFGDYVAANGGRGCTSDVLVDSLHRLKGIHLFRLSEISEGQNGIDATLPASTVQGGERGYIINGTGPSGNPGESNNSATGGTGFGAGGGAGGAIYFGGSPKIYAGGKGADGVVYVELTHSVCTNPVDVMFAVESRKIPDELDRQLNFVRDVFKDLQISHNFTRVALISYAHAVHLKYGFNDFADLNSLENAISNIQNDLNVTGVVQIADVYQIALIAFFESYSMGPSRGVASKAFVLLTYGGNFTQMELLDKFKNDMREQGIVIVVVVMGNNTYNSHLESLVDNVHNLYTENTTAILTGFVSGSAPWIVELICQDQPSIEDSPSFAVTSTAPTASRSITSSDTVLSYHLSTPSLVFRGILSTRPTVITSSYVSSSSVMSSAAVVITSSPTLPIDNLKTVEQLEKDLDEVLKFNITTIDINNLPKIKKYIGLAGNLLAESERIPNASERRIEFQLLERVESIGLATAEQMKPTSEGYKTLSLSSGKVEMEVASLNLTKVTQIRFPDIPRDVRNETVSGIDSVQIMRSVFPPNMTEVGQVVWMTFDALTAMNNITNSMVTSRVMNIIVQPRHNEVFQEPIRMRFQVSQSNDYNSGENDCVFWDENSTQRDAQHSSWSNHGCQVVARNHSTVTCHCDHLTSFAVLTKVNRVELNAEHQFSLTVITCVGCGLSILGCVLTIATYAFLPSLRSQRNVIHLNLVIAILLAQICFLVAAFGVKPDRSQIACFAVAVGLFYFYMCVFTWMLAEGVHIYCLVIRVFDSGRGRKVFYLFIGWGLPLVVTAISVSVLRMKLISKEICWLSVETGAIWSFVGPVVFIMVVNFAILIMVMRVTSQMLNEESGVRSLTKAFGTLLPILGLTWVFGLLAVNKQTLVFEYLFTIFNSTQGFLIFIVYCLTNSEIRREFKRKLRNMAETRNPGTSLNPSTTPRNMAPQTKHDQPDKTAEQSNLDTKL